MPRRNPQPAASGPYRATPELERRLHHEREVQLEGGAYRATVARSGRIYEAWTDSPPFVYGPAATSLQEALGALDEAWRRATAERRAS